MFPSWDWMQTLFCTLHTYIIPRQILYLLHSHCICDYYINLSFWKFQFCKKLLWGYAKTEILVLWSHYVVWRIFLVPPHNVFSNFSSYQKPLGADFCVFSLFWIKILLPFFSRSRFSTLKSRRSLFYRLGGLEGHWPSYSTPPQLLL